MQVNHRNGQDDCGIVEISEPFTIMQAALNRQIISSGAITGSSMSQRINRKVISPLASLSGLEGSAIFEEFFQEFQVS